MFDRELLEYIECAIAHDCCKSNKAACKCAKCEIGYSPIVQQPIMLKCGHQICQSCVSRSTEKDLNCKFCGAKIQSTGVPVKTVEWIIKSNIKELYDHVDQKLSFSDKLLTEVNGLFEKSVLEKKDNIKSQIDAKLETLKSEIEDVKNKLYKQVDEFFNDITKRTNFYKNKKISENNTDEVKFNNQTLILKENELEKATEKIQYMLNASFEIDFESSTKKIDPDSLVGSLNWKFKEGDKIVKKKDANKQRKKSNCLLTTDDKKANIWNIHTGESVLSLETDLSFMSIELIKPYFLMTKHDCESGEELKIWNLIDGKCIYTSERFKSYENSSFITVFGETKTHLWDPRYLKYIFTFDTDLEDVFVLNEKIVAVLDNKNLLKLLDISNGACMHQFQLNSSNLNECHLVSPCILYVNCIETTTLWNLLTNECFVENAYYELENNEQLAVYRPKENEIKIIDANTCKTLYTLFCEGDVTGLEKIEPNFLACFDGNGKFKMWDTSNWRCVCTLTGFERGLYKICPLKPYVFMIKHFSFSKIYSFNNGSADLILPKNPNSIILKYDNFLLIDRGNIQKTIDVYDISNFKIIKTLTGHLATIDYLDTLDENKLISIDKHGLLKIWSKDNWSCVYTSQVFDSELDAILHNSERKSSLKISEKHLGKIKGAVLLKENMIATHDKKGTINVWDTEKMIWLCSMHGQSRMPEIALLAN